MGCFVLEVEAPHSYGEKEVSVSPGRFARCLYKNLPDEIQWF